VGGRFSSAEVAIVAACSPSRAVLTLDVLAALPATAAEQLVGRARVIGGDTIVVDGIHVQLQGMAASEVGALGSAAR
jgi:endonuclease YncB( thermonuclease family)